MEKNNPILEYRTQPTNFSRNQQQNTMGFLQRSGKDILLYRGELARCADLLAFQLGKELLFRQMRWDFFFGPATKSRGQNEVFGQTI